MKNKLDCDELDAEKVAALEAALKQRDPYTGLMRPSYNEIKQQAELEASKTESDTSVILKQSQSVLPEVPLLRSRTTAIAMICVLFAAVAFVAYGSLRSKKSEAKTLDSISSEPEKVMVLQEQKIETELKPVQLQTREENQAEEIPAEEVAVSPDIEAECLGASCAEKKAQYDSLMEKVEKAQNRPRRMELLREAIEVNPDEDEARSRLAFMLAEYPKHRDEALTLATKAVDSNPDNARAWLAIGYIHQIERNREAAVEAYSKCVEAPGPKEFVKECKALLPREHRPN